MSVREKSRAVAFTARIAGHYLTERISRSATTARLGEVPAAPESLTPEWLTAVLCDGHPDAKVESVALTGGSDGTSSRRAISVEYNEAGRSAGLPTELFSKSTTALTQRIVCGLCHLLENESGFYTSIRPELDMEAPVGYHAEFDPRSFRSLFLLENVVTTKGATFGNPLTRVLDRAMAEDMVSQLACYHGAFWDSPRLRTDFGWLLTGENWHTTIDNMINTGKMFRNGVARGEAAIPPELLKRRKELWPALFRAMALHSSTPQTLVHADVHAGNWYRTADGRMGLYDWQCTLRGNWALDFAYALMSNLTIENRRAWERELLEFYLDRLKAAGGDAPGFNEAWLHYRQQTFQGMFAWVGTLGQGRMQPDMQPRDISLANVERIMQAIADLESLDSLNESYSG
ncbi:aminoglycoside phosphotransferase family protein [Nocardia sp. NPDC049220]|uniref:aminoglycoside phosphotransferase family protein n=1 Tax=Nocardia sp. NPDC049220 TaxID=3155273 RepID=UPI0033FFACDD